MGIVRTPNARVITNEKITEYTSLSIYSSSSLVKHTTEVCL